MFLTLLSKLDWGQNCQMYGVCSDLQMIIRLCAMVASADGHKHPRDVLSSSGQDKEFT